MIGDILSAKIQNAQQMTSDKSDLQRLNPVHEKPGYSDIFASRNQSSKTRYKPKEELSDDYLQRLMQKHTRQNFLQKDIKAIHLTSSKEATGDMSTEFAKQCYRTGMPPVSKVAINDSFKSNLYSLHNTNLSGEQVKALGQSLRFVDRKINELCFNNNSIQDKDFADLLLSIKDAEQFSGLSKIICVNNNEVG